MKPLNGDFVNELVSTGRVNTRDNFEEGTKICTKCRVRQSLEEFYINRKQWNGEEVVVIRSPVCRTCKREQDYVKDYGITIKQYDELFDMQNGLCAICKEPPSNNRRLAVDHDHKTGEIRGLLCIKCNISLGWYDIYWSSIDSYLER